MPMIGARFYTQLDAAQMRNDVIEEDLAKVKYLTVPSAVLYRHFFSYTGYVQMDLACFKAFSGYHIY